jgi:hypothetical protein
VEHLIYQLLVLTASSDIIIDFLVHGCYILSPLIFLIFLYENCTGPREEGEENF